MHSELPIWAQGLEGRKAFVTGGSKGLGRAIAEALADAGANVTAIARDPAGLDAMAKARPGIATWAVDICSSDFPAALEARDIDILVNNAGTNAPLPMVDTPVETLDRVMALNVRATYLASQAAVRSMLRTGSTGAIINITSQMGHVGGPLRSVYCMTKHAIEGLTKAMAIEFAAHGIRVNSVAPTFIETPLTKPMLDDLAFGAFVKASIPLGKLGQPDDVAAAVVYLASPAAAMVTGTSLRVDGGWTAQ